MAIGFRHVAVIVPALALAACNGSTDPADLPYGTPQQLMANEVQPTAETYWGAVKFESLLVDGEVVERDIRPETDAEWEEVRASAARLAELGEVMLTDDYTEGRGEDWKAFAQGLVDISGRAEQAAIDQDPDAVFEVGGLVYNVCKACHQFYPPEQLAEGMTVEDLEAGAPE